MKGYVAILNLLIINSIHGYTINLSFDQCVDYIFSTFDENNDDYLDKWECEKLQLYTNPTLPLTWKDYKYICNITNAIFALGLNKNQLRITYSELSHVLGTNIYNDVAIMLQKHLRRRAI